MPRDVDATFADFVASSGPSLLHTAYLLTGHPSAAEDLVQSALLRCLGAWRRNGLPDNAEAYARTVVIRKAVRSRRRLWNGETAYGTLPEVLVEDEADSVVLAEAVRRALRQLPVEQRAVLVLRYWEHLSEAEIAYTLSISPGTVKSRASRGLAALRATGALSEESEVRRG